MGAWDDLVSQSSTSKTAQRVPQKEEEKIERTPRRERGLRLPRGTDREQLVYDFYLPTQVEQEGIKAKASTKVKQLLDVLDNFNRVYYGVTAAGAKLAEASRYHETPEGVGKAFVRGLKREEKKSVRDIAHILIPEKMQDLEENTKFKVFGIDMDAASVPLFFSDVAVDPFTWIPFGLIAKVAGTTIGAGAKGAKLIGKASIGEKAVEKIIQTAEKAWYTKIAPYTNIKSIWKRQYKGDAGSFSLDDLLKDYIQTVESTPLIREKQIRSAATVGEKNMVLMRMLKTADQGQTRQIFETFHRASDEAVEMYGDAYAKKMGMDVEDFVRLKKVDRVLGEMTEADVRIVPKETVDFITQTVGEMKSQTAKKITRQLLEHRGIKNTVHKMVGVEKAGALALADERFNIANSVYKTAISSRESELRAIQKTLKSDTKLTSSLLTSDIDSASKTLKNVSDDLSRVIRNEAGPEIIQRTKDQLNVLKTTLSNMRGYELEQVKGIQALRKSDVPARKIDSLVKKLEMDVGRAQLGKFGVSSKAMTEELKEVMEGISRELRNFKQIRTQEISKLKVAAGTSKDVQQRIVSQFNERVSNILGEISTLKRYHTQEKVTLGLAMRKADKFAAKQAKNYEKAFRAFSTGKTHNSVMREMMKPLDDIMRKHVETLPKELQPSAWKLRELLDQQKVQLKEAGLTQGVDLLYAPRSIAAEYVDEFSKTLPQYRTKTGFLKHREFEKFAEFKDYIEKQGGKIENDLFYLTFDHLIQGDMAVARRTLEDGLTARFGTKTKIPMEIKKTLDYLYRQGANKISNPVSRLSTSLYGRALNAVKFMLTSINPAFHGRNILGFPFLASTTAGVKAGWNPANYVDALMLKSGRNGVLRTRAGDLTYEAIREAAEKSGYFGASLTRGNIERSAKMILNRYSWKDPRRWMGELFKVSMHSEDVGRYGALIANLKSGKALPDALDAARSAMFDYNLINSPIDKAMDGILGFYTFTRRNLPRQFMTVLNDPKQYAILSRSLNKISNRENLTQEEAELMNSYDKETLLLFGEAIDGVREFTSFGFFPVEEAYRTLNAVKSGDVQGILGGRVNPMLGSFLDWYYGKDSFSKTEMGTTLPPKYSAIIPKKVQETLGLTDRKRPKYRGGEIVGTETVLYGDPDTIFMIRRFPLTSRVFNDMATLVDSVKQGKPGKGLLKYFTGVRSGEMDVEAMRKIREIKERKELMKKIKEKGGKVMEIPYIPKEQKKEDDYRKAIERLRGF